VDWIVRFVRFHSMLSREHLFPAEAKIESFLTDLAVHANVSPATQNQAMNALVFLYKRVLNHPLQGSINAVRADKKIHVPPDRSQFYVNWAKDFANFLPEKHAAAAPAEKHPLREPTTKTDKFRDHVTPGEVERQFSDLVEALKTEVRSRHYSYRTETSYLDWVRRFIAFHDYANPRELDASAAVLVSRNIVKKG
jgi:hypothetical protein